MAQTKPDQSSQQDNPFPGESPAVPRSAPAGGAPPAGSAPQQESQPGATQQKPGGDNPFPGETTDAPIIPVDPGPNGTGANGTGADGTGSGAGAGVGSGAGRSGPPDAGGDPVRSPDGSARTAGDDGFSSSRSGVGDSSDGNADEVKPGKAGKVKTRAQEVKEDIDVGEFYLEKKNWKAAEERYGSAFKLDGENEDALWGLAEAERHLGVNDKAREHYELFLAYDPKGPHSKAARKALDQLEAGGSAKGPVAPAAPQFPAADASQPR